MDDPWLMQILGVHQYSAIVKMVISSKIVNQNMLKIPYSSEKFCKILPSSGGFASRSQLASGGWELCPQPPLTRVFLPTPTVLLQNVLSLSSFSLKVLRKKF